MICSDNCSTGNKYKSDYQHSPGQLPQLSCYQSTFTLSWVIADKMGLLPSLLVTTGQMADTLVQLFEFSVTQARNVWSAVLLILGFGGLKFHPLSPVQETMLTDI